MIEDLPLCGPPNYEYEPNSPFFVCHINDKGRASAWIQWTMESAVLRFWLTEDTLARRVVVDAAGVTVLGATTIAGTPRMCGTRQTMEQTLALVRSSTSMIEMEATILTMMETIRSLDGQAM